MQWFDQSFVNVVIVMVNMINKRLYTALRFISALALLADILSDRQDYIQILRWTFFLSHRTWSFLTKTRYIYGLSLLVIFLHEKFRSVISK